MEEKPAHEDLMRIAAGAARENLRTMDGGPFGAVIARDGRVLAVARNLVLKRQDPTRHAEINAIRRASALTGTYDLSGCRIYTTTEPCTMCLSAIHWARIDEVYYGTDIEDAAGAGFNEMRVPGAVLLKLGGSPVKLFPGVLREECLALFREWEKLEDRVLY